MRFRSGIAQDSTSVSSVLSADGSEAESVLVELLSGAQAALTDADVKTARPKLKEFFTGQKLTSGSSGWLARRPRP